MSSATTHLKNTVSLARNTLRDVLRYYSWSTAVRAPASRSQLRARLTFVYHKLEKGLAMRDRRPGFGRHVAVSLVEKAREYEAAFGQDDITAVVREVLQEYRYVQAQDGFAVEEVDAFLEHAPITLDANRRAGSVELEKADLFPLPSADAVRFLKSRRSVRDYTGELVSREQIERVVALAQRCPSVCNRQTGLVYASNERETIDAMLSYQNGNTGFGHTMGGLFIVASDLTRFNHVGERHQAYVDGGIFAMALCQALHAEGLGSCMLNWSTGYKSDNALRARFNLPESIVVITMLGFGHASERLRVAASPREKLPIEWLNS